MFLQLGIYSIHEMTNGNFWIAVDGGEGMETSKEALEALIDRFFRENF